MFSLLLTILIYSSSLGHRRESRQRISRPWPRWSDNNSAEDVYIGELNNGGERSQHTSHYCIEVGSQRVGKTLLQGKEFLKCKEIHIICAIDGLCNPVDLISHWKGASDRGRSSKEWAFLVGLCEAGSHPLYHPPWLPSSAWENDSFNISTWD